MPKAVQMTWIKGQKHWTKMHKGVRYYISPKELGTEATMEASVHAANRWWEEKKRSLDMEEWQAQQKFIPGTGAAKAEVLYPYLPGGLSEVPSRAVVHAAVLAMLEDYKDKPELRRELLVRFFGAGEVQKMEREAEEKVKQLAISEAPDRSVGYLVNSFLTMEQRRVALGNLTAGQLDNTRRCIHHFQDWLGENTDIAELTEQRWETWYRFLVEQLHSGTWGDTHCDRHFSTAKRFVRYLWELKIIELPRNLNSRQLVFTVTPPEEIEHWTVEDIAQMNAVVKNQPRLHFLLMLNCAMLGKDISDLKQREVDWCRGIITRKRSKTRKKENVPVVRFKLWDETFALLKEYRSADPERVLLTKTGQPWIVEHNTADSHSSPDKLASNLRWYMKRAEVQHTIRSLRATGATFLGTHPEYSRYAQYFLGHAADNMADKHYVKPSEDEFFKALLWLEGARGLR